MAIVLDGTNGLTVSGNNTLGDASTDTLNVGNGGLIKDASGNVGVGVTPKTWSLGKAIEVGASGSALWGRTAETFVLNNAYYNGGWVYAANGGANYLATAADSEIYFGAAATGTAASSVSFTNVFSLNKDKTLALQGATSVAGTGITFPATQSASSNANTLDDYEEGDFTPSWTNLTINSGTPVYTGWYTKVGRLVTVGWLIGGTFNITLTANSSRITNLPFTSTQTEWGIWGNVTSTAASYGMQTSGTNLWMAATVTSTGNTHSGTVTYIVST